MQNIVNRQRTLVQRRFGLRVTRVEIVASLLLSALAVSGGIVLILFLAWLTRTDDAPNLPRPLAVSTTHMKLGLPADEAISPQATPLELDTSDLQTEILHLLGEVPSVVLQVEDAAESAQQEGRKNDGEPSTRDGSGVGNQHAGDEDGGNPIIPAFQRWELKFTASNLRQYAEQLDHLGFELGCVGAAGQRSITSSTYLGLQAHGMASQATSGDYTLYGDRKIRSPAMIDGCSTKPELSPRTASYLDSSVTSKLTRSPRQSWNMPAKTGVNRLLK